MFGSIDFFKKLRNFFEHQYRSKISLRIEWEHSQPLKFTLKHSNLHPMNLYQELTSFGRLNKTNALLLKNVRNIEAPGEIKKNGKVKNTIQHTRRRANHTIGANLSRGYHYR